MKVRFIGGKKTFDTEKTTIMELKKILFITKIPSIMKEFKNLVELTIIQSNLIEINFIPETVKYLDVSENILSNVDNLPSKLETLVCRKNKISSLLFLPLYLTYLNCSDNCIEVIDYIPPKLKYLNCSANLIKNFDNIPKSITNMIGTRLQWTLI